LPDPQGGIENSVPGLLAATGSHQRCANGRFIAEVGLPTPIHNPEHALLLPFTAL
jgi:hypothetical protein